MKQEFEMQKAVVPCSAEAAILMKVKQVTRTWNQMMAGELEGQLVAMLGAPAPWHVLVAVGVVLRMAL